MLFDIVHLTDYRYGIPASEAYIEARLTPPSRRDQDILSHRIEFSPTQPLSSFVDYFGNEVNFYSMTLRHERLTVVNRLTVRTKAVERPLEALEVPVADARQLFSSTLADIFDYLQPTPAVPTGGTANEWAKRFFHGDTPLGVGLDGLNKAIHQYFTYLPGVTDNSTPLSMVWKKRAGVCQDFAHIMLSVLRTAGIPSRYVCGYIESEPAPPREGERRRRLVGSLATHAWVEALIPGMSWVALDPTNNQWCGQQHVTVSLGRDFRDAAPVRGTFKGSGNQAMTVKVSMKRTDEKR